jgi:hypothetical protein
MFVSSKAQDLSLSFSIKTEFTFDSVKEKEAFRKSLDALMNECEGTELGDFLFSVLEAFPK